MTDPQRETVTLRYPVEVDGQRYESLTMRRAKARDSRDAAVGGGHHADYEIRLFANLAEVAPAVIEELDMADYSQLQERFRNFVEG